MERFVFIAAVTIAILFGAVAAFGGSHIGRHFHFDINDDGPGQADIVALAPGRVAVQTFAGTEIRFKSVAARVVVVPEDRTDFTVEIDNSAGRVPMPTVSADDGKIIVDGQLRGRIANCRNGGASLRGYDDVATEQLPVITVHAPRALVLDRDGAGSTEIGATQSLNLDFSGCSAATVGDVAGALAVDLAGSGSVHTGAAHSLNADVAGSGELFTGAIAENADVDLAGSGEVTMASLAGTLKSDGAGSGNLHVQAGAITDANIDLAGSGNVDIGATVQSLNVSIVGSGNVDVGAAVGTVEAEIAGSGDVRVQSVSGEIHKQVFGSGNVTVGGR